MKIVAIIQARTSSTRLPNKVLKDLPYDSSFTVLDQVIRRTKRAKLLDDVVIATTVEAEDEQIVEIAKRNQVLFFRGSVEDVLSRYYHTAREFKADVIIRITSDCPCIDWNVIDDVIKVYVENDFDYVSNTLKRTFPHGLDTEVFSFEALERTFLEAKEQMYREHVTLYIYTTNEFRIDSVEAKGKLRHPEIRITLDTEEDYALLCAIYDFLYPEKEFFDVYDVVNLFEKKPWLYSINKKVVQKKQLHSLEEEIDEAIKILDLQDLKRARDFLKEKYKD